MKPSKPAEAAHSLGSILPTSFSASFMSGTRNSSAPWAVIAQTCRATMTTKRMRNMPVPGWRPFLSCVLRWSKLNRAARQPRNICTPMIPRLNFCLLLRPAVNRTPNLERLAKRGLTFTRACSASPLCSPTRSASRGFTCPPRKRRCRLIGLPSRAARRSAAPISN